MSDEIRAFEEWWDEVGETSPCFNRRGIALEAWQSAWNHRPVVSVVPGVEELAQVVRKAQNYPGEMGLDFSVPVDVRVSRAIHALLTAQAPARGVDRDKAVNDFRMDELDAVMMSVDKWFGDNDPRLKNNPATRAADAREIALQAIESALLTTAQGEVKHG